MGVTVASKLVIDALEGLLARETFYAQRTTAELNELRAKYEVEVNLMAPLEVRALKWYESRTGIAPDEVRIYPSIAFELLAKEKGNEIYDNFYLPIVVPKLGIAKTNAISTSRAYKEAVRREMWANGEYDDDDDDEYDEEYNDDDDDNEELLSAAKVDEEEKEEQVSELGERDEEKEREAFIKVLADIYDGDLAMTMYDRNIAKTFPPSVVKGFVVYRDAPFDGIISALLMYYNISHTVILKEQNKNDQDFSTSTTNTTSSSSASSSMKVAYTWSNDTDADEDLKN